MFLGTDHGRQEEELELRQWSDKRNLSSKEGWRKGLRRDPP